MYEEMTQTFKAFAALFRRGGRLSWTILMPLVVIGVVWAVLRHVLHSEREAFMAAFVTAFALRLAMRADGTIQSLTSQISNRTALILALMLGPMALTALVWLGDPVWCQRFLSLYFLLMACLYLLDVIDGRHAMLRHFQPGTRRRADPTLSRVMAICYMALLLLNETLIREASLVIWLVYFGLLPVLLNRLLLALRRTVDQAQARGIDLL
jgi:hypothetical protein